MFGLGVSLLDPPVARAARHAPSAPAPLAYLPALQTAGAAYHVVLSNERLVEGYDGPLALLGNGVGTVGASLAGAGATGIRASDLPAPVSGLYGWFDQSGGGRNLVEDTLANRPHLAAGVTIGGRLAAAFWGIESRAGSRASLAGAQTLAAGNRTEIWVVDPSYSIQNAAFADHADAGGAPSRFTYIAPSSGGVLRAAGSASDARIAAQPQIWVIVDGPSGAALFVNGTKHPLPAGPAAAAIARTTLGWSPGAGAGSIANFRLAAYASIDAAVNDADAAAISRALMRRFAIASTFALNLVHIGDSIVEGINATDTIGLKAMLLPSLTAPARYLNLGVSGKKQADCHADRAQYEAAMLAPGKRNVALIDAAINDLCFGADGAALYAETTTPYVAALRSMGYEVGLVTVLPQNSTAYGVPVSAAVVEGRRAAYNAAVRGNAAGADFVVDRAADPVMGAFPASCDDPALYPDALHPSTAGYARLAPIYAAAINARP